VGKDTSSRPYVVGLTGGIGSGKSTVASLFAVSGVGCIDADVISRELVCKGSPALQRITDHFGAEILLGDGSLDRRKLRSLVFSRPEERLWLESLLHPLVRREITDALQQCKDKWILLMAPLLLENNLDSLCDRVLVVDSTETLQVSRTMDRDGVTGEDVLHVMASQMPRQERLARADDVIANDGSLATLESAVKKLKIFYDQQADNTHPAG
jgi:dephospho-CoA kinase